MKSIENCGRTYGLILNFSKVETLSVGTQPILYNSDNTIVKSIESLKYLGCVLQQSGLMIAELKQKLATARHEFKQLSKVWNHTSVLVKTKYAIYQQCVVSKLLYGLESAWLSKRERKMLDSFQIQCLRQMYKISHSMISRISNKYILAVRGTTSLSNLLLRRQLIIW